jgi:hypothetical protein
MVLHPDTKPPPQNHSPGAPEQQSQSATKPTIRNPKRRTLIRTILHAWMPPNNCLHRDVLTIGRAKTLNFARENGTPETSAKFANRDSSISSKAFRIELSQHQ